MHHFSIRVPEDILITVIIVCNNKRAIYHRTLLPSIFMTGVHPPSPHPKSPMWQRTVTGAWPRQSITSWLAFDLLNMRSAYQHKFGSRIEELDNHNNNRPWGWIVRQLETPSGENKTRWLFVNMNIFFFTAHHISLIFKILYPICFRLTT